MGFTGSVTPVRKQTVYKVLVPFLAIAIFLSALELCARLYLEVFALPRRDYDYRKKQPAPYKNAPYFSREFISESFKQPGGWQYPKGTRLIIPNDYSGTYFNVRNGTRVTAFQPEKFENTVYLFGGSTIYNAEVPDDLTIASQLQLFFKAHYGDRFIVQNYGTTTVTVAQQLERLKALVLKPKDIVVFYDGVNDIYQGLFYASPEETMIERNRRAAAEVSPARRVLFALYARGEKWSSLVRLCCDPTNRSVPPHFADAAFLDQLLVSLKLRYKQTIEAAAARATKSQAKFYHFLQPHLFASNTFSEYEKQLLQNHYIVPRGLKEAFQKGYPALKAAIRQLPETIPSYDLTEILNKRPSDSEYFLDSCHVNHEANRVIAAAIFGYIHRDLKGARRVNSHAAEGNFGYAYGCGIFEMTKL